MKNPIIKATKKYKISETLTAAKKVINVINPLWWAKRFISTASMNLLFKEAMPSYYGNNWRRNV
ncbi:MAG: hypothetical protein L6U99_10730 [Clostridium sp.]|nr:MAG: hypothetical protein L6U99_10730 [Clostridium sp.]